MSGVLLSEAERRPATDTLVANLKRAVPLAEQVFGFPRVGQPPRERSRNSQPSKRRPSHPAAQPYAPAGAHQRHSTLLHVSL
jgi:hypothetical protein